MLNFQQKNQIPNSTKYAYISATFLWHSAKLSTRSLAQNWVPHFKSINQKSTSNFPD